ncbi:MAG: methyltransferase, partial [Gaiellaceae bacterium]
MESATSAYLRFDRQLLAPPAELGSLPLARANFESALERPGGIALGGWMLLPDLRFDSVEAYLDHRRLGAAQHVRRNDLADYLPAIAHAGEAGFSALLPLARSAEPRFSRVDLVGMRDGLPAARVGTLFRSDLTTSFELPPAELRVRVAANESAANFRLDGLRCAGELLSAAERQLGGRRPERLLEWGCGCGRIAAQLLDITRGVEINGCDIDEEAIDWCNARLRPDAFRVVPPEPPSSYENGSFDLVLGYSVFTHLTREAQNSWLEELHRIATPDALVLATVHGDFAASFLDARAAGALAAAGILDGTRSGALDGIAPDAYYRTTFQSREYTLASWGERFEILEYLERGCGNLQDLVVMRPRERPRRGGTSLTARTEPAIPPGPSGPAEASGRQQPIARGERGRTARASSLRLDPRLLVPAPGHRSLPVARGNFENAVERWDGILVSGWILPLQQPFESVEIFLDQRPVGSAER